MIRVLLKVLLIAVLATWITFMGFLSVLLFEQTAVLRVDLRTVIYFLLAWYLMFRPTMLHWVTLIRKYIKPTI
jgi:hypothetical protein